MKSFLVILPDETYKALKHASVDELRTMKAIVEQAIAEYIEKRKSPL